MHKSRLPIDCRRSVKAYAFYPQPAKTVPVALGAFTLKKIKTFDPAVVKVEPVIVRSTTPASGGISGGPARFRAKDS
jgi:hypothetical protein